MYLTMRCQAIHLLVSHYQMSGCSSSYISLSDVRLFIFLYLTIRCQAVHLLVSHYQTSGYSSPCISLSDVRLLISLYLPIRRQAFHLLFSHYQIFGPVQQILKFKTMDEVLARANDSTYGLGAAVFTNDINKAMMFSQGIKAGSCW